MNYDVIICGAGPAGSACAAFCASNGLKTVVLEKSRFPRDKVCGDCINPSCWPVLERLQVADRLLSLPHSKLAGVEIIGIGGRSIRTPLRSAARGEIAVKRSVLDQLLLERAIECGAEVRQETTVTEVRRGWTVRAGEEEFTSRHLVAADGRNSTVLRLLGLLPAAAKERVAIQTHIPVPAGFGDRVVLQFLPGGYCGYATVGGDQLNLCLVSRPGGIPSLKTWSEQNFEISPEQIWRTITPLARKPVSAAFDDLWLAGDSARVVEPFTGEGIYYALASGELAASHIFNNLSAHAYERAHAGLYAGRLWVNRISKQAALHPLIASIVLEACRYQPRALRFLTAKVVGEPLLQESGKGNPDG